MLFNHAGQSQPTSMVETIVSSVTQRKQRIPPGQYKTEKFPVLDLGTIPDWDPKTFRLRVWGEVERPLEFTWEAFRKLPRVKLHSDFHCVTRWSRLNLDWEGVHVREILQQVRAKPTAKAVMAHCLEGYTTNLAMEDFNDDDVIIADTLEGKPLPREHGGPMRLLVPKLYGWKSAKFLTGLQFLPENTPGYWEERGYHLRGEYLQEQRYW